MKVKRKRKLLVSLIALVVVCLSVLFGNNLMNEDQITANVSKVNNDDRTSVSGNLMVSFIDVGQADSILIQNDGNNMLIDAGNNEDGNKLVSYFKELGINHFNYVVGTHPHEDHIGGMDDVINNFKIDNYYMPDKLSTTKTFEDVLDALENNNLSFHAPTSGEEFNLGDAKFRVIYSGDDTSDTNDSSIVLKMAYGSNTFLFTGDATSNVENKIINEDIKSDVLKVAHHGSNYSSTDEFLNKVSPKYAIISVGKNNSYNHPSSETLQKLDKRKIKLYRTDMDGTIIFTSDGSNLSVQTSKTDTNG